MNLPFGAKIWAELTARAVIRRTQLTLPSLTSTILNYSFAFLPSAKKHEDGNKLDHEYAIPVTLTRQKGLLLCWAGMSGKKYHDVVARTWIL